jgi:hypothetical protein
MSPSVPLSFTSRVAAVLAATCALAATAGAQQVIFATSFPINPQLLTVDPLTGTVLNSIPISGSQALFGGLTAEGATLYSIDGYNDGLSDRTFRVDSSTGAGTIVGDTGENWNFRSVEIHPLTGVLYATRDNELYTIDKITGLATSIGAITGANLDQFTCFAINGAGVAYGFDIGGTGLYQLDLVTAAATHLGDVNSPLGIMQDAAFDSAGTLWVSGISGGVSTIDINTQAETFRFGTGSWGGFTFSGCASPAAYCTSGTSSAGCVPSIQSAGAPSAVASSGFTLSTTNVDGQRSGIFFYGITDPAFTPTPWGTGGTSFLCVKAPTQRMAVMTSGGTLLSCNGSYGQDWNAFMASNPGALGNPRAVGQSFDAQLWMRDPPSVKTTILSNALRFVICP